MMILLDTHNRTAPIITVQFGTRLLLARPKNNMLCLSKLESDDISPN
jgi:hypothetical protein